MIKTPNDRADRTYSVPSAGHIGGMNNQNGAAQMANHHNYMLPLSPGGQGHQNSITPKSTTHAQMQRQSINEGLTGNNSPGGHVSSSINPNSQMFTRFSNIQLQNSMQKNGGKISGQGGRAFQSVNNFFNPRTAGAQKHPQRERISTHHF